LSDQPNRRNGGIQLPSPHLAIRPHEATDIIGAFLKDRFTAGIKGNTFNVISTRVGLQYPYSWHFNKVIVLVAPGATYQGVTQIAADATVPNMD
jgi:hypothetical protein